MRIFYCFAMVLLLGCSTGGPVEVDGVRIEAGLRAFADGQNFDYTGYLDKALKGDDAALQALFKFNPGQDSAASTGHGLVLKALLAKMGDELFSQKIAPLPEDTKHKLWAGLELAGATTLKNDSPQTMKALLPSTTTKQYSGLYFSDGDNGTFRDCDAPENQYLVVGEMEASIRTLYQKTIGYPYPSPPVVIELVGQAMGYYGNHELPDNYTGFILVTNFENLKKKNFRNTCIPYDFWALGTEPFWEAQVSATEGVIEYRGMDDQRTMVFAYQPPVDEKGVKIYTGINQDSGDNIRIAVDSTNCSDGMSDNAYKLGVKLTINGKELNGCGIPFELGRDTSSAGN